MFNDVTRFDPSTGPVLYLGPERRRRVPRANPWLAAALDEIDYGMLLLADDAQVVHANHAARADLDAEHPLQLVGRELRARRPQDVAPLADAVQAAAQRGLRRLLSLGEGAQRIGVSVVPLGNQVDDGEASGPAVLVMLGKRNVCGALSVQGFSHCHRLTSAESRVLEALCRGTPPTEIAVQLGVAISTVRTQIGNIRQKTGASSIRALVRQVAVLPPLMGVLRSTPAAGMGSEASVQTLIGA